MEIMNITKYIQKKIIRIRYELSYRKFNRLSNKNLLEYCKEKKRQGLHTLIEPYKSKEEDFPLDKPPVLNGIIPSIPLE
jgi:hypothetical protein